MLVGSRWLQAIYRKLNTENLVKHGFPRPQDISLTENSDQVFLPGGGGGGVGGWGGVQQNS